MFASSSAKKGPKSHRSADVLCLTIVNLIHEPIAADPDIYSGGKVSISLSFLFRWSSERNSPSFIAHGLFGAGANASTFRELRALNGLAVGVRLGVSDGCMRG